MPAVFNVIQRISGSPQQAEVKIELLWDTTTQDIVYSTAEDVTFEGDLEFGVDEDGRWEKTLTPNDSISPADNIYRVTETVAADDSSITYFITVPDEAGPIFVGSILAAQPDWVA